MTCNYISPHSRLYKSLPEISVTHHSMTSAVSAPIQIMKITAQKKRAACGDPSKIKLDFMLDPKTAANNYQQNEKNKNHACRSKTTEASNGAH